MGAGIRRGPPRYQAPKAAKAACEQADVCSCGGAPIFCGREVFQLQGLDRSRIYRRIVDLEEVVLDISVGEWQGHEDVPTCDDDTAGEGAVEH